MPTMRSGNGVAEHGLPTEVYTLANDLHVVLLEDHSAPVVALQAWVRFGSADEESAVAGIAHVFEHMLFKGSQRFPGSNDIAELIEGAGGTVNAWTSYDETVYHVTLASRFWQRGFDVLSDALLHSLFPPEELLREKEVVYEEFRRSKDSPDHEIAERLFALTFSTHPYGRPVIGYEETFSHITRDDMLRVFHTWYVPNNMVFVAVGDFDSKAMTAAIAERFGPIPALALPPRPRLPEPVQQTPRVVTFPFASELARIEIALPSVAAADARAPALDVLSDVLGAGYNSVLYTELKRRRDLVHDVYAFNYTPYDRGVFLLGASCVPEQAPTVLRHLSQHVHTPALSLSEADLAAAKTRIVSQFIHARETYQGIADQLGRAALLHGDADYGSRYVAAIEALSRNDLQQVAHEFLTPQCANIAMLMPQEAALPDEPTVIAWSQPAPRHTVVAPRTPSSEVAVVAVPGGSTLIVQTDRKAPLVSVRTVFDAGQRVEPAGKEGLARLFVSTWDRGTALRSAAEIERDLDRLGATLHAASDRDSVQLAARFLKGTFAEGLDLYFEILAEPSFPEMDVEREQGDQLRDLDILKENRFQYAFQHFLQRFYGPHPYNHLAMGLRDGLAAIGRNDLFAFHQAMLQPHRTVHVVVGDIAVDEVVQLFDRTAVTGLGTSEPTVALPTPAMPVRTAAVTEVIPIEGQQTHIIWGFPTVTGRDRGRYALRVLDTILGGMGGRLFVELRDRKSLAYTVTSFDAYPVDPGFLALYIACSPDKEAEALREFQRVVQEVQQHGVTAAELERAKTYLEGALDIGLQGTSQRTAVYGTGALHLGKWDAFRDYVAAIWQVSAADVQQVAQTYLDPSRSVFTILRAKEA